MAEHNILGERGEQLAVEFLRKIGYDIIAVNWRHNRYEIDVIAIDNSELVFIEVKTRATDVFGNPEEAVTIKKQQHLIDGADFYIQENEIDLNCRFDVVSIVLDGNKKDIRHFKSAFYPEI